MRSHTRSSRWSGAGISAPSAPGPTGAAKAWRRLLLRPILDECDRTGTLAWLETSSDDNVRLYERLGFVEVVRLHTPDETRLPLIVMERRPHEDGAV